MITCNLCAKEVSIAGICQRCQSRLHQMLDDLVEFWSQAHEELLPGKGGGGGRSSERTLGVNVAALSFIAGNDILGLLHEWEKLIRQERQLVRPAFVVKEAHLADEIASAIAFAQTHLAWLGATDYIGDFASELKELHSLGIAAARAFVEKTRRIPCPSERGDGLPCGAMLKINSDDPLDIFTCRGCKSEWSTLRLMAVALAVPGKRVWLDAEAIASWTGLSERQVYRLVKKHKIAKRGQLIDATSLRSLNSA